MKRNCESAPSLHTGGVTGSIPVSPTINHLIDNKKSETPILLKLQQTAEQSRFARVFWHVFDTRVFGLFLRSALVAAAIGASVLTAGCTSTRHAPSETPPEFRDGKPLDLTQFQTLN
jgi:hypothetical protein